MKGKMETPPLVMNLVYEDIPIEKPKSKTIRDTDTVTQNLKLKNVDTFLDPKLAQPLPWQTWLGILAGILLVLFLMYYLKRINAA